jgi:hypothetical protein
MSEKLLKTSLQIPPSVLADLSWPGLSRSESLRLSLERGHYLSCLNSENVSSIADEYSPILREALEDLGYEDYRLAVRSLPAIVAGFLSEDSRGWEYEHGDRHELRPAELVEKLKALDPLERIGILDCVVAARQRRMPEKTGKTERKRGRTERRTSK